MIGLLSHPFPVLLVPVTMLLRFPLPLLLFLLWLILLWLIVLRLVLLRLLPRHLALILSLKRRKTTTTRAISLDTTVTKTSRSQASQTTCVCRKADGHGDCLVVHGQHCTIRSRSGPVTGSGGGTLMTDGIGQRRPCAGTGQMLQSGPPRWPSNADPGPVPVQVMVSGPWGPLTDHSASSCHVTGQAQFLLRPCSETKCSFACFGKPVLDSASLTPT